MKVSIEKFLGGHIYPILVAITSFIIWSFHYYIPQEQIAQLTFYSLFVLTIPFFLILIFFDNTIYTVPIILFLLFTLGMQDMGVLSLETSTLGFLNVFFVFIGMIIHISRFKVKFKLKTVGLSLLLAAVSFIIPQFYSPWIPLSILLNSLGFFYLFIYLFYANTIKGSQMHYLMRVFALIGLTLSFQLVTFWYLGYQNWTGTDLLYDFIDIFPTYTTDLPGWGNVNDLTIQLVLTSCAIVYYMKKYSKNILPWLYLGWIAFWIYVSDSRGSIATITFVAFGYFLYAVFKHNKRQLINLVICLTIAGVFLYFAQTLVGRVWNSFFDSLNSDDPNAILSYRPTLWWEHEFSAWNEFLRYPIFGTGWYTKPFILNFGSPRLTIYHSTFFHVLATGGIFGIGVLIFHFVQVGMLFRKNIQYVSVATILFTYIITQIHGLVDNTMYMVHYSIVTYIMFAVIENKRLDSTIKPIGESMVEAK